MTIRLPLEGRPAVSLDFADADEELRLREHVAANLGRVVAQLAGVLARAFSPPDPALADAIESAGLVVVRSKTATTVAEVAQRVATGDSRARAWLVWALLTLDDRDPRFGPVMFYLEQRHPELLLEFALEAVLGGEA